MKGTFLIFALFVSGMIVKAADPIWSVNSSSFNFSMTVTAVLQTGCKELTTSNNRLGAFVNGVVRGSALNSITVNGRQLVFLTVYSNQVSNEVVTFKVYNAQTDAVVDVVGTLVFQDDASFGTPGEPILMTDNNVPSNLTLSSSTVMENNAVGYVIGNLSVNDRDAADTHTYSLVAGTGDADNSSFSINGNKLIINVLADYETKTSYSIRISSADNRGCSVESVFTITVLPFNDPPTDINLSANTVREDAQAGIAIGQFSTLDQDVGDTFTYTLVAGTGDTGNALFTIVGNELRAVGPFDFETLSAPFIRVRTTDSGSATFEKIITITIIDVNEVPYGLALNPAEIDENLAVGSVVGDLTAMDQDAGDVVTFTLDPANTAQTSWFEVVNNKLVAKTVFNFEDVAQYSVDVIASDAAGLTARKSFTVAIRNVNDTPTDLVLSANIILENLPIGTQVGSFTPTDEDVNDTFTYSLVSGTNDNASFTINGDQLLSNQTFNLQVKSQYIIEVAVTDFAGASFSKSFTIAIKRLDIMLSANMVKEDAAVGTVIGQLTTISNTPDPFTYSLVTGTGSVDNALFTIIGNEVKSVGPYDFETKSTLSIRVQATDPGTGTFEKSLNITVMDVNEAPYGLALNPSVIDENLAVGSVVGDLTAMDQDAGDVVTFSLDPANTAQTSWFEVVNNKLVAKAVFNFEDVPQYTVDVMASDAAGLTTRKSFYVSIRDVNDSPKDLILSANTFLEDQPVRTVVGEFTPTDEDLSDTFTYSFVSGNNDNASFTMDGNQLLSNESFNYNVKDSYTIEVTVTDLAGASFSKSFTIAIEKLANSILPSIDVVTPNGDGINDTWVIQEVEKYSNFSVKIYDNSGIQVYTMNSNYDNSWNGSQGGSRLPTGTYYYVVNSNSGSGKSYSGTISLLN